MARRNFLSSNPATEETLVLPYDEAVARIKASRNRKIFLMVHTHAPAVSSPSDKYFDLLASVPVTAPAAVSFLESAYGKRFKTEALVTLRIYQSTMFVG